MQSFFKHWQADHVCHEWIHFLLLVAPSTCNYTVIESLCSCILWYEFCCCSLWSQTTNQGCLMVGATLLLPWFGIWAVRHCVLTLFFAVSIQCCQLCNKCGHKWHLVFDSSWLIVRLKRMSCCLSAKCLIWRLPERVYIFPAINMWIYERQI